MGFCYDNRGRLVCDICGAAPAKKYRCPFGYCQATAACEKCRKERAELFGKPHHREHGCEANHNRYVAQERKKKELLERGEAVRCSALGNGDDRVHVLFRLRGEGTIGFYMATATYHAIPMLEPATPNDYRQHGELTPAPADFGSGRTTKQVVLA
jgi:hypothetical protein